MKKTKELFEKWNEEKIEIEVYGKSYKIVKKGEIWISKIGVNIGGENSKNNDFIRPVLIISIGLGGDLIGIIPFTSGYNINYDKYYFELDNCKKYGLEKESRLLLNQFKVISKKRLLYKINNLSTTNTIKPIIGSNILKLINEQIKNVFNL